MRVLRNGVDITHLSPHAEPIGLQGKMFNAAAATQRILKAAAAGRKVAVPREESDRRMAICATCEFYNGLTCSKCGCVMRWKARLSTEHCPIAKW